MHRLFDYINRNVTTPISEQDFEILLSHFIYKKIRRKQYFLQKGEVCKYGAFILKGSMRKYYIDDKGAEHIVDLYIEDWWAADRESYTMLTPTIYDIDACEDCEVLLLTNENVIKITNEFPAFNELRLKMDLNHYIANQKRVTSSISFSAEKRYLNFIENHPDFLQRFPQHYIASYLGITKETLSRVRKDSLHK